MGHTLLVPLWVLMGRRRLRLLFERSVRRYFHPPIPIRERWLLTIWHINRRTRTVGIRKRTTFRGCGIGGRVGGIFARLIPFAGAGGEGKLRGTAERIRCGGFPRRLLDVLGLVRDARAPLPPLSCIVGSMSRTPGIGVSHAPSTADIRSVKGVGFLTAMRRVWCALTLVHISVSELLA